MRFLSRHRRLVVAGVVAAIAVVAFVLVWFQPQKLFVDESVDEQAPAERQSEAAVRDQQPSTRAAGSFKSLEHRAAGRAILLDTGTGTVLRFEDFEVENGPDLFVYLSAGDPAGPGRALADDFVDLGRLKGNIGDQNYAIPDGTNLERYRTAVIWCRRFTVAFAAAELQ